MKKPNNKYGFTLIELIITIALIGVIMIPLGFMSMEFMYDIPYSRDLGVASGLARIELAKLNNLAYGDATLAVGYDNTTASYEGYPYNLRRTVTAGPVANLKTVQVRVYPAGSTTNPLVNVMTYVANVSFGSGSSGGPISNGTQAFLAVSNGDINKKELRKVTLQNTDVNSITITGVIISFIRGTHLTKIELDKKNSWDGSADSGDTITLIHPFILTAGATYNKSSTFNFSSNLSSVTSLVFIMSDGSNSISYSW